MKNKIIQKTLETPVKVYENADTQKQEIFQENKGKSGIYMWVNSINGKRYVGSAQDLSRRIRKYYSINGLLRGFVPILRAFLKYGHSNFKFTVLEYCAVGDLVNREQH